MAVGEINLKDKALVKRTGDGMIKLCPSELYHADTSSLGGNLVPALAMLVILESVDVYGGGEPADLLFSLLLSLPMVSRSRICVENDNTERYSEHQLP